MGIKEASNRARARVRRRVGRVLATLVLASISALILTPLVWTASMALKPAGEVFTRNFLPTRLEWGNFREAATSIPFFRYFVNTLWIVVPNVVGMILTCSLVAYGFSRFQFKGKRTWFLILLATMMLPGQITMIPQFLMYRQLGWVNTILPLTVPAFFAASGYNIFLLRSFMGGIPKDFDEAAIIDGAGPLRVYSSVIMPMSMPVLTAITVFTFMGSWNDFNGPLIYLYDSSKFTLSLGLSLFKGQYTSKWNLLMAATVMVMLPVLVMFFMAQDSIINGISISSGTKG